MLVVHTINFSGELLKEELVDEDITKDDNPMINFYVDKLQSKLKERGM